MVRLDDIDDGLHDRDRREKFAAVMGFLVGELGQEVFVDAPEDIAVGLLQRRIVDAQKLAQDVVAQFLIFDLGSRPFRDW